LLAKLVQHFVGLPLLAVAVPVLCQIELLTTEEAARLLKVSPWTLRKWEEKGRIAAVRLGGAVRYEMEELRRFVEAARNAGRVGRQAANGGQDLSGPARPAKAAKGHSGADGGRDA